MSYTLAWILKCLKLYPSISLIDDSAAATQPLSHSATHPLCQSGWSSHSATLPKSLTQPLSHSATLPVAGGAATRHSARVAARVAGAAATQPLSPLCHSRWSSHSATQSLCQSGWSSHSATQPLSHSGWRRVAEWLRQPLCQSGWVAEWLMWKFPPLRVQSNYQWIQEEIVLVYWMRFVPQFLGLILMSPTWCHHWKSLGILLCDVASPLSDLGSAAAAGGKGISAPAVGFPQGKPSDGPKCSKPWNARSILRLQKNSHKDGTEWYRT